MADRFQLIVSLLLVLGINVFVIVDAGAHGMQGGKTNPSHTGGGTNSQNQQPNKHNNQHQHPNRGQDEVRAELSTFSPDINLGLPGGKSEDNTNKHPCYAKPKKIVKNRVQRCRCMIYQNMTAFLPENVAKLIPAGAFDGLAALTEENKPGKKRKPCKLPLPIQILVGSPAGGPLKQALVFFIRVCFWKSMSMIKIGDDGVPVFYYQVFKETLEFFDTNEDTKKNLSQAIDDCVEEKYKEVNTIPLPEPLKKMVPFNPDDIAKCICIDEAFKNHCSDAGGGSSFKIPKLQLPTDQVEKVAAQGTSSGAGDGHGHGTGRGHGTGHGPGTGAGAGGGNKYGG